MARRGYGKWLATSIAARLAHRIIEHFPQRWLFRIKSHTRQARLRNRPLDARWRANRSNRRKVAIGILSDLTGSRGFRRRDSLCLPTQVVEFSCRSRKPSRVAGEHSRCAVRCAQRCWKPPLGALPACVFRAAGMTTNIRPSRPCANSSGSVATGLHLAERYPTEVGHFATGHFHPAAFQGFDADLISTDVQKPAQHRLHSFGI